MKLVCSKSNLLNGVNIVSKAAEFTMIHEWERKYNSYLKTAEGYASTLKACTSLYDDGVRLFINLCNLKKAIAQNPQGIVATASLNNLYIETATELVTVYTTLKDAVAKGSAALVLFMPRASSVSICLDRRKS